MHSRRVTGSPFASRTAFTTGSSSRYTGSPSRPMGDTNKFPGSLLVERRTSYGELPGRKGRRSRTPNTRKNYEVERRRAEILALLEAQGWERILVTIVLGTLGEITVETGTDLSEHLGVRRESLNKLLTVLHGVALKYMHGEAIKCTCGRCVGGTTGWCG
eukprot:2377451-Pyramimonas_sp.AAC.1